MSLLDEIESLRYLSDEQEIWNKINDISKNLEPSILRKTIDDYLTHLIDDHRVPGQIYLTLSGIGDWIKEHNSYTQRQLIYSLLNMAEYWDELDLFKI